MQRSIKFRAWDKHEGVMCSFQMLRLENIFIDGEFGIAKLYGLSGHGAGLSYKAPIDRFTLMQFTGFHDRNGVEIYELDLVTTVECECPEDTEHEVDYEDACFYAGKHELSKFEFEIVGNKYEGR